MKSGSRYDSRILTKKTSGSERVLKRRRAVCILLWFVICVTMGFVIYKFYSQKHMSDKSVHTIELEGSVSVGNELKDDVPFGPWMADK